MIVADRHSRYSSVLVISSSARIYSEHSLASRSAIKRIYIETFRSLVILTNNISLSLSLPLYFQLALMQANQDNKHGLKGLKRQLSGRFKRMISRKPSEPPTPTIPPELKPQLKTIYVY